MFPLYLFYPPFTGTSREEPLLAGYSPAGGGLIYSMPIKNRIRSPQRLYDSQRWRSARHTYLGRNPLCLMCKSIGRLEPATVVDHVIPHRNDMTLFWDTANWQPLCKHCHDSYKQRHEKSKIIGCNEQGLPLDPSHHWN